MRGLFVFMVKYLFTVVLLVALVVPVGFASSFILLSRDELVSSADAILVGRIDFIKSTADENGNIHSFIAVKVQRDLFGQVPEQTTIYLKEPGGRFRGISGWAFGSPEFEVGEDVVLFVKLQPDGFFRVAHMFQGKFRLLAPDRLHRVVEDAVVSQHEWRSFETLQQIQEMAQDSRPLLAKYLTELNLPDAETLVQFSLRGVSDQGVSGGKGEASSPKFYTLGGGGIRWNEFDGGTSVRFYVNPTASPLSATDTMTAVNSALQAWNSVASTKILLANGGQTSLRGNDQSDNTNVITFGDPQNLIQDPTNCSGTLAITYITFSSSSSRTVNGTAFKQIFQADLVFNNGFDCFFTLPGNLAEVLGHEMGHAIGFGHSSENPSEPNPVLKDALMYFRAHGDGRGASPRSDDIAAAQFVYPSGTPSSQAPTISALAPTEAVAGSGGFTLGITGTNFVSGSTAQWNGATRTTTFISSTQLQANILASDIAAAGSASVTVQNPSGGGLSNAITFLIRAPGAADLSLFKAHSGVFSAGSNGVYTLTVTNVGSAPSSGAITVTDTLPAGLSFVSGSGGGWNFSASGQSVTATNLASFGPGGSSSFNLTVSISAAVSGNVTNTASVSNSSDGNPSNNTASDTAAINGPVDLTISKTHTGNFTVRSNGTYTLTVSNVGSSPSSGVTTVTDSLPAGLSFVSAGGSGWTSSASGQTVTSTNPAPLAPGALSSITITVSVGTGALGSVTNVASVSNPSDINPNNNTATDPTFVVGQTDLSLTMNHSGSFTLGSSGTYTLTITNVGSAPSSGPITVTDNLPLGLSFLSAGGAGWTFSVSGQTVTGANSSSLAPGASSSLLIVVNIVSAAFGSITNLATLSNSSDTNPANNTASDTLVAGNPSPIISGLSPGSVAAGSAAFTLIVNGSNFVSNSTVQWNGQDRPTTFVSSARLQVAISAADLNRAATVTVAVTNPSPGGGASNASAFSVTAPLYYFAQFGNGSNFVSSLVATNASRTETANGSISLFDEQGQPLAVSFNGQFPASTVSFTIPPLGSATFTSDGGGSLIAGSARVSANIPLAVVVKFTAPGLGITGVAESAPLAALMTPVVRDATRGVNTGIAITNTQNSEVRFILSLRGLDGVEALGGSLSLSLVAGGHFSKFINELFPNASTANFQGSLIVTVTTAGGAIAATAIQVGSSPGEFTTLPVVAADPAPVARDLIFAQFGNGSGFTSSLFLNNPLGSTNAGDVSFFDDDGNPLPISIGGAALSQRVPFNIQPQGGAVFTTNGLGSLVSGSARVTAANAIGGVLRFAFPGLGTAGVGASPPVSGFIAPVTRSVSRNLSTGVAIASAGSPVTLTLTLRNRNGELVPGGQTTLQLRANGHRARFIEELFTGVDTREFEGTLTVTADGGDIAGTALQLGSKAGEFTTLPVTAIR
ncbi:MAG TPA: hypothetical protein VGL91_22675 [Acidobacteriota bacterium]